MLAYCKWLGDKGILCKLDFKKIFDGLNWDFLFDVLPAKGFLNWVD